ncbi:PDR/VanB family oxidoreductase [Streptomyces sp. NPDC013178]|uniref:PDR/VanB family oxidoreductase n=1 Tax=Streptomyces sp. NPDC013178 TaxID=3155118 RepID=UPI0033F50A5C
MTALLEPAPDLDPAAASLSLLVTSVRLEAQDVISITLADPLGQDLPEWGPGAHLELELPSGLRRQYSLCGSSADRKTYRVAVLREANGRGGSRELHDTGVVGRRLNVYGPRNHFELCPSSRYLFIAGGIGITPILAMVRAVSEEASWVLHYGGRSLASMAFVDELAELGGERVRVTPQDVHGLLDLDAIVGSADDSTVIFCCGPSVLLDAVQETRARLAPQVPLYFERFGAAPAGSKAAVLPEGRERAFEVELRRTGVTLQIDPDCTVLDAIREVVPAMPFSCTEGYCGSCEVAVLDGVPDHRDEILTPEERESGRTMFPCVSRSCTDRLVIDL